MARPQPNIPTTTGPVEVAFLAFEETETAKTQQNQCGVGVGKASVSKVQLLPWLGLELLQEARKRQTEILGFTKSTGSTSAEQHLLQVTFGNHERPPKCLTRSFSKV